MITLNTAMEVYRLTAIRKRQRAVIYAFQGKGLFGRSLRIVAEVDHISNEAMSSPEVRPKGLLERRIH